MWRSKTFTISKIAYCLSTDKYVIIMMKNEIFTKI